jgi:predicted lipoprotein with Yx(FWY)xxD motif
VTQHWTRTLGLIALTIVAALILAACGDDDDDDGDASATATSSEAISTESIDGTDVVVDADGRALYTADQEQGGEVLCTAGCLEIWDPVLVSELGADPESFGSGFADVRRPDGGRQLTLDGSPLYAFTEEGPGELTGDGLVDSFAGTEFSWSAAVSGDTASSDSSDDAPSGGGAYGGY